MTLASDLPLMPGEHVRWEGRPADGLILSPMDAFLIPFSLLWTGFAIFWNAGVWTTGAPVFFRLSGLPFLLVGAYFVVGRFLHDQYLRRRTSYRLTNERILIDRKGRSQKSLDIRRLPALELSERSDGTGSIRFGAPLSFFANNGFALWSPSFDPTPQFIRIDDARRVYLLIQQAARSAPAI